MIHDDLLINLTLVINERKIFFLFIAYHDSKTKKSE